MPEKSRIFELYADLKEAVVEANDLNLTEVAAILRYASDQVVVEYGKVLGELDQELAEIHVSEKEWPATAAIILEMKQMVRDIETKSSQSQG